MDINNNMEKSPRYLTVNEWCKTYSWPPVGGLRHLIFHANSNGFNKVIVRCGRRVLLNEARFWEWLTNNNNNAQEAAGISNKSTSQ